MFENFADIGPYQLIGLAGFFVYIFAFSAVQFHWMNGNSNRYSIANIIAASLVAISLIADFNLASALIQGSWILIGLAGLVTRLNKTTSNTTSRNKVSSKIGATS